MPADERDEQPTRPPADEPVKFTPAPEGAGVPAPLTPKGRRDGWRRVVNRRNAIWTGLAATAVLILAVVVALLLYRSGQIDRIIARQIVETFARYGVRAEIGSFETKFGPRTAELRDVKLYDAESGAQLGEIDRLLATVRIEDMYALSLRRNVNLESLELDGLELWVTFDAEGRSNFSNLRLPEPDPNSRILFSYSTANIKITNALIHYDDRLHSLSGEGRNLRATVRPEDPSAPAESRMNVFEIALSDSTFTYDGRPINDIDIEARGRANQTRAELDELLLRSPVTEARLTGTLDDWRALRYQLRATASVDLTQISEVLRPETTLRGAGRFEGTVSGEGENYRVEGQLTSDALAADGVRLQALNVNATGKGSGKTYEVQGRAVAELLTAGDFRLNGVQLAGGVTGTGTDFRWLGDLRAAALRSKQATAADLIVNDAVAEYREGQISGRAASASAAAVRTGTDTVLSGVRAAGINFRQEGDGTLRATVEGASVASIRDRDTRVADVRASGIDATVRADESAQVSVGRVQLGSVSSSQFSTGALNIAGVRLNISPGGGVEGATNDIDVGNVALAEGGRAEGVRLARPRFTLAPSGSYRASADLSLGGGVLGQMRLGSVRAEVVATNTSAELKNFVAEIFNGRARGNASFSTARGGTSHVTAEFEGVDVGGLVAAASGRVVPLTGAATGTVDLRFPGTNYKAASGRLNARFTGETGAEAAGRTPLTGDLAMTADDGNFTIDRASLRAGATELNAAGTFSFEGGSDLNVRLASADAAELQRVVVSTGLVPELETKLAQFGVELAGALSFDGTLRGDLDAPLVSGRVELASLRVRGQDLGALAANIESDAEATRVTDGRLTEPDGGGVRFAATIPRTGENNISVEATLENANAGKLLAALMPARGTDPLAGDEEAGAGLVDPQTLAGMGPLSGSLSVTGAPGAMQGSADLRGGAGVIGTQRYEELALRATFGGDRVNVENVDVRLEGGTLNATGSVALKEPFEFDLRAKGQQVRLDTLVALFGGGRRLPALSGIADFNATASGNFADQRSYRVEINARGQNVQINGQPAGELTLTGRTTADNKFTLELTTGVLGQPQTIRAVVDLSTEELATTVETTFTSADLTQLFQVLLPGSGVRATGRATGSVRASGNLFDDEGAFTLAGLRGRAEFSELVVEIEDVQLAAENPLVITFSPSEVAFERTRFTGPGTDIVFGGTAALGEGGRQNLTIDGNLNLRAVRLSPNTFLGGTARVGVRVGGTYQGPEITGTAEVSNGSLATLIQDERLQISQIAARIRFNTDQAEIETLTGRLGGGRVSVTGGALLAGLRPSRFRFEVRGENVAVPFPQDFRTTADAELEINGSLERQLIEGVVRVRRTEYTEDIDLADFLDRRRDLTIEEGISGTQGLGQTFLDLQIEGRDALVVRNNLGDIVGSVSLRAQGPVDDPLISGRITATRGTLNFRNNRFEIQRAIIDLPARRDADPVLNIAAEGEIRGYRVTVQPSGPLSQLQVSLRSDPPLPQGDVVSLITTGNLSSGDQSASVLSQTGVGTATSLLTDSLINAPVRRATDKLFGLNRFEIDPLIVGRGGASPTARLTVGRQINRNLSVTYSTNVTGEPNQVLAVEYRLSDRLSFVARYQQGSPDTLRTQNNDFSFEVRFRKRY